MIELSSGCIRVDNLDLSRIPRQDIRARLNAIAQDPYFLSGSIRTNLDPHGTATDAQAAVALEKVQLGALIQAKGGLNADFDVDMLSHGQRQLFCLARAMLRKGKIVVLDEATSSVDRHTDALMQQIIREEFAHHTIIAIAHRLETILDFDRIIVLERGQVVECDSPSNLLARDSLFRELYESSKLRQREGTEQEGV